MAAAVKISRRRVVSTLVEMLDSGTNTEHVAHLLAGYLVKTGQVRNIELFIRDIELMMRERFGVALVRTFSARELSDKVRNKVEKMVKSTTGAKTVEMVEKVEPGLIGGIVVRTADAELDGSIRTKIRNLRSI